MTTENELTAAQWVDWIAGQVAVREKVYCTDPDELVSAYNREVSYARDYHGRELLELLQNADDAGVDYEHSNKVAIVLTPEGLCVANTGRPFSESGVKSLMVSDNSPKKSDRAQYIGNKGLGFRSVLSWTNTPFILSGNLAIGFDSDKAQAWLESLCREDAQLRQRVVSQMESTGAKHLVPILALPLVLNPAGTDEWMGAPSSASVWQEARQLQRGGYDTVIAVPFTSPDAYEQAKEQLKEIGHEFLLFTKHLAFLSVRQPDLENTWWIDRDDDIVGIKSQDEDTQAWQVFEKIGDIPSHLLSDDLKKTPSYEIKVAVSMDDVATPGFIFNYFKTQARFPYPVVAHVTFELSSNRQNIPLTPANQYLVKELAGLMAEVAEVSLDSHDPWRSLSFISTDASLDPMLEHMGLFEALCTAAQEHKVIPVRSGEIVKPCDAKNLKNSAGSWLPPAQFGDVVQYTAHKTHQNMLRSLKVQTLTEDEMRSRLNQASAGLSIVERAALITGLCQSHLMPSNPAPSLLVDQDERLISPQRRVFLPPGEAEIFALPKWLDLRMLHSHLSTELKQRLKVGARDLTAALNVYTLTEFSLTNISNALIAETNARVKKEPEQERSYRIEALEAIYGFYRQSAADSGRSSVTTVQVPTASGGFASASTLYFSNEFIYGRLSDLLYRSVSPHLVIAPLSHMNLENEEKATIGEYLKWLGVADKPRRVTKSSSYSVIQSQRLPTDYMNHVRQCLEYPAKTTHADLEITSSSDLLHAHFNGFTSIEHLEELIVRADPRALLAWIALDERIEGWRREGETTAEISVTPPRKQHPRVIRGQFIPSYILWLLGNKEWLPSSAERKQAPTRCILASSVADELKFIFPRPALTQVEPLFQEMGIDHLSLQGALQRIGVRQSLEELTQDEIYQLLLDLPSLDPTGQCAKSLQRALVLRPEDIPKAENLVKAKFLKTGKLWGVLGNNADYYSVTELYYIGTNVVPQVVVRSVPHLELDKKQGAQKVQRIFGVRPLDERQWQVEVKAHTLSPAHDQFLHDVDSLKPFIYALRLHATRLRSDASAVGLQKLKSLEVHLCCHLEGTATVGEKIQTFNLAEKGEVILNDSSAFLFTGVSPHENPLQDVVLVDAVAEVFAEVLGVEQGSDFARLISVDASQRMVLLVRILGTTHAEAESLLQQAQVKLESKMVEAPTTRPYAAWVPVPAHATTFTPNSSNLIPAFGASPAHPLAPQHHIELTGSIRAVAVEQQDHLPAPPARRIQLRVQATPSTTAVSRTQTRVTDAARCQEVIIRFEEAQGRFPLSVSQLQGELAYGCDVLSFASAQLRQQFTGKENAPDISLIQRLIEVKGKSSEDSTIEMRGNELRAAQDFGERYFLYRVYEGIAKEFAILVLANPLASQCNHVYEVNMSQQQATERFRAVELEDGA